MKKTPQIDNSIRRSGIDRRQFSYTANIPERRYAGERRNGLDNRNKAMQVPWSRTHFIDKPEKRNEPDRRKNNLYIASDKRSGIACRRKEMQREMERKIAARKTTFYPNYYKID